MSIRWQSGEKKAADRANGLSDQILMRRQMFKSRLNALTKLEVSRRCWSETSLGALGVDRVFATAMERMVGQRLYLTAARSR